MPLGTIHWIPHKSGRRSRPYNLTSGRFRLFILILALFLTGLATLFFQIGRETGIRQVSADGVTELILLRGEVYQLSVRVRDLTINLEKISIREEQILVAGAGLNLDFSGLLCKDDKPVEPLGADIFRYIDDLEMEVLLAERLASAELMAYDSLVSFFIERESELAKIPTIWPVDGIFVSDFGPRIDPFTGAVRYHKGIDLACVSGTPIYTPADGVVIFGGWTGGWGLNIVVRHTEHVSTRYAHCSSLCSVVGQRVMRGDLIARVGSTGRSVAPHLHYEVLIDGAQVDPEDYIIREGPHEAVF